MLSLKNLDAVIEKFDLRTHKDFSDTFKIRHCSEAQAAAFERDGLHEITISPKPPINLENKTYCNISSCMDVIRISTGIMEYAMREMISGTKSKHDDHITIKFSNRECSNTTVYGGSDLDAIKLFGYHVFFALSRLVDDGVALPPLYVMSEQASS